MLRFLLLRFLPRRLFPLLMVFEAIQLFRSFRRRNSPPIDAKPGQRVGTVEDAPRGRARRGWMDRTG